MRCLRHGVNRSVPCCNHNASNNLLLINSAAMKPELPPRIAVLLVNLGTPDEPTAPAVRRYLKQFLSDPRVIEIPKFLWAIILNLFVLPSRPKRVASLVVI